VLRRSDKFKIMEIALISEALYHFKSLDNNLITIIEKNLVSKIEHANAQDLAIFSKVLFKAEYSMKKTTLAQLNKSINLLYHNIDANCLKKMFEDFEARYKAGKYDEEYINFLFRKLRNLRKDNMIKGVNFSYIKGQIVGMKSDDMLRKKIEKALNA
jgi:hypothetical protein